MGAAMDERSDTDVEPAGRDEERDHRVATRGRVDGVVERVGDARPPASPGGDEGLIDDRDRIADRGDLPPQPPVR
jgi:hypothetical protein